MKILKCKWKYGCISPVVLMIDDFANKYMIDINKGNYLGSDWGGRCKNENSLYEFIEKNIFEKFPYVKLTMFLVVGRRAPFIENGKKSFAEPINYNMEFMEYLNELNIDSRFEIAYHGLHHGKISENGFRQEWELFDGIDDASETIQYSKKLYNSVTRDYFKGGKYCGYKYNEFSDESISKNGFRWWCRHWDGAIFTKTGNGDENLELELFNGVVDIPSTVDGSIFSLKLRHNHIYEKAKLKALYYKIKYGITIEKILDELLSKGQIINIQEHSSPIREDDKRQQPNIIDDIENIQYILNYLKKYDLWYATADEVAKYFLVYNNTNISLNNDVLEIDIDSKSSIDDDIWVEVLDDDDKIYLEQNGQMIFPTKYIGDKKIFALKCTGKVNFFNLKRKDN